MITNLKVQIAAAVAVVGTAAGFITGSQTIIEWQPLFAPRPSFVDFQRVSAFNRISDLQFQIDYLIEREVLMASGLELKHTQDELELKTAERNYLQCTFRYVMDNTCHE